MVGESGEEPSRVVVTLSPSSTHGVDGAESSDSVTNNEETKPEQKGKLEAPSLLFCSKSQGERRRVDGICVCFLLLAKTYEALLCHFMARRRVNGICVCFFP